MAAIQKALYWYKTFYTQMVRLHALMRRPPKRFQHFYDPDRLEGGAANEPNPFVGHFRRIHHPGDNRNEVQNEGRGGGSVVTKTDTAVVA